MLAAARAEKSPLPRANAAKPAAKKAGSEGQGGIQTSGRKRQRRRSLQKTGPMDTSSILAAARSGVSKPGPMSKSEAAGKGKNRRGQVRRRKSPRRHRRCHPSRSMQKRPPSRLSRKLKRIGVALMRDLVSVSMLAIGLVGSDDGFSTLTMVTGLMTSRPGEVLLSRIC